MRFFLCFHLISYGISLLAMNPVESYKLNTRDDKKAWEFLTSFYEDTLRNPDMDAGNFFAVSKENRWHRFYLFLKFYINLRWHLDNKILFCPKKCNKDNCTNCCVKPAWGLIECLSTAIDTQDAIDLPSFNTYCSKMAAVSWQNRNGDMFMKNVIWIIDNYIEALVYTGEGTPLKTPIPTKKKKKYLGCVVS